MVTIEWVPMRFSMFIHIVCLVCHVQYKHWLILLPHLTITSGGTRELRRKLGYEQDLRLICLGVRNTSRDAEMQSTTEHGIASRLTLLIPCRAKTLV
jgi:hypothetical protein